MADEQDPRIAQADHAAATLLQLAGELAEAPMLKAAAILRNKPNYSRFQTLVQLEIAGSMAIERLLTRYMSDALKACKALPEDGQATHMMQAMVNPMVGGLLAFTDDMPPAMQRDFCRLLVKSLGDGMVARAEGKEAASDRKH